MYTPIDYGQACQVPIPTETAYAVWYEQGIQCLGYQNTAEASATRERLLVAGRTVSPVCKSDSRGLVYIRVY